MHMPVRDDTIPAAILIRATNLWVDPFFRSWWATKDAYNALPSAYSADRGKLRDPAQKEREGFGRVFVERACPAARRGAGGGVSHERGLQHRLDRRREMDR